MSKTKLAGREGGCECGKVRYRVNADPIVVNCCHCTDCQRQTGSGFALNVLIEPENVELLDDAPIACEFETPSGQGQANMRCAHCKVSVWSVYHAAGDGLYFLRGGTVDDTSVVRPDIHIFTDSKLPWVTIPDGDEQFGQFYAGKDIKRAFGEEGAARFGKAVGRT